MTLSLLSTFLGCFADELDRQDMEVVRAPANRLRTLKNDLSNINKVPKARVPVQSICEEELRSYNSPLAKSLADLLLEIHVTRSEAYLAAPPSPDFGDNYGYGIICGPNKEPPPLIADTGIAFGLMLLGPGTHYPLHHHPADEIYYTVTGPSSWQAGNAPWSSRSAGEIIHHPSWVPHATLSGDRPLVLLYIWQGDLLTDAVFVPPFKGLVTAVSGVGSR
ncbi:dimethylsulfonioproprionate lyase family protein [Mesorhizobium sp. A623]